MPATTAILEAIDSSVLGVDMKINNFRFPDLTRHLG